MKKAMIDQSTHNQADETRLAYLMNKTMVTSFVCHFCFIGLFSWLGVREMAILNIFSSTILFISVFLTGKKYYIPAFIIGTSELILHAVLATYYIGWASGFHYFLLVLTPLIFFWPYWNTWGKIGFSLCLFGIYILLFFCSRNAQPIHPLTSWQIGFTTIITVFTAFLVFAAVALYYQMSVNRMEAILREANSRLEILAKTDPLTDLHNRRVIEEKLGEEEIFARENGRNFSVVMSDIDHFKQLNDTYGHQVGDQVLVFIAKVLKNATRTGDVVARWGGEEFLILLPNTGGEEAKEVAERMRIAISQAPVSINGEPIQISMTFGVAECTFDTGINSCIQRADKALYNGKMSGRNQVVLLSDAG